MRLSRVALCAAFALLCTHAAAQPTSTRPPRGTPKPAPATVPSKDVFQVTGNNVPRDAQAVVAFICSSRLTPKMDGSYALSTSPLLPPPSASSQNVCADQPFKNQPVAAFCSGVLITPNLVATSATCLTHAQAACNGNFTGPESKVRAVFGFALNSSGTLPSSIPAVDVATPVRILKQSTGMANNWALVELDRSSPARAIPLSTAKIRGGPVNVIGHPQGLPAKVTQSSLGDNSASLSFTVPASTVGHGMGTPAFSLGQLLVEGLVVNDPVSWTCSPTSSCCKTNPVPGQGTSATIIRGSAIAPAVCGPDTLCGTTCVNTSTDINNCGGCGNVCSAPPSQCHEAGVCSRGKCSYAFKASGAPCNDGNACTVDVCNGSGACVSTGITCNSPPNQCYQPTGTCSNGTCSYTPKPSGAACDDGNACTTDACNGSGVCIGTGITCNSPPNQCYQPTGSCSNGTCSYTPKSSGAACDDGNPCTTDACNGSGTCVGTPITCNNPPNQCYQSTGTCSNGTCSYTPKSSGTACDDGNACTTGDVCNGSGSCSGTSITCSNPPNQCYHPTGSCSGGTCSYTPKASGTACTDGNACTNDACDGNGTCVSTTINCNDGNECTADGCNPSTGCTYTNRGYGTACSSDGKSCTLDVCDGFGTCAHYENCPSNEMCDASGHCYCPYQSCNGVCTDTNYDSANCGYCGRLCASGCYCASGQCVSGTEWVCPEL
jgi:hypothetical protein